MCMHNYYEFFKFFLEFILKLFPNSYYFTFVSIISLTMDTPKACGPPSPEAIYTNLDTVVAALHSHARCNGYALFKRDSRP